MASLQVGEHGMSKENKAVVHRFPEGVWTKGNLTGKGMGLVEIAPRRGVMRPGMRRAVLLSAIVAFGLMVPAAKVLGQQTSDSNIVTFEVPGAGKTAGAAGCGNGLLTGCYGTTPMANNNFGEIVGMYITDSGVYFGFLRAPDGKVTSFTAPGADTTPEDFNGTYPMSINSWGVVTGLYQGTSEVLQGFIREANGTYVEVDDPDAGTSGGQGTWPTTINDQGEVAGFYFDADNGVHGFVRSRNGEYQTVDDPNGSGGTLVALEQGLNSSGAVAGWYYAGTVQYGYVREPDGLFNTIEPSASAPFTYVSGINCIGATTGYFGNSDGSFSGYLRKADGPTVIFNVPGPNGVQGTAAFTLNALEEITGVAVDASGANHGFVRFVNGGVKTFDAAKSGSGNFQGTRPTTINDAGQVIGYVLDASNVSHGFIRSPDHQ
jgi:hypothetical protein